MSSLDKVKYYEKDKLKKKLEKLYPVVLESKLDGLTVVAYPKDGTSMFVTRGNGVEGEILHRFPSEYCGINKSLYPIRGEAFLPIKIIMKMIHLRCRMKSMMHYIMIILTSMGVMI